MRTGFDAAGNRSGYTVERGDAAFSVSGSAPADEGGTVVFTVSRSGDTAAAHSVDYATQDGTATAPADFTAASGTLTFQAGETAKTVDVATVADSLGEPEEQFSLALSSPSAGAVLALHVRFARAERDGRGREFRPWPAAAEGQMTDRSVNSGARRDGARRSRPRRSG